ncbi:ARM repeat-containing protein [Aulographum hederae CBS 113979]|uniref:ARM repeat-containing protein n=1 Tax=Aulographum hederae CBS 113979 TaxID=1176131 RepID=A0A6G1HAL4_9PEZI|nr:ARM repeat-containing protein [Aulographum hederae CBS 113979]
MSAPEAAAAANGTPEHPELDVTKLHSLPSEQQDLYLLSYISSLLRLVSSLDADGASAHQVYAKRELFKIINLSSPAPNRVIRKNLGATFAGIFGKGDRKLLFESINELLALVNSGKSEKDVKAKHAAVYCLGTLFEAAGDSAISLSTLACSSSIKHLKLAQNNAGFKSSVFKAIGRIVKGVGRSADEATARDMWKQARSAASGDKSLLVQSSACWCLEQLLRSTSFFDNSNDFDKLQSAVWKAIDSPSPAVRHAAASSLAAALVKSYSDDPKAEAIPRIKKPKKNKKQAAADGDDEVAERPDSPAPSRPATLLSYGMVDLLKQLSVQYCRQATSNRARAGIAVCYVKVFKGLEPRIIESNYGVIARHFLNDLLSYPSINNNRYRQLITRKYVRIALENVAGRHILGESGQINAAKWLLNEVIKDYPQAIKERPEPGKHALIGALSALSSLLKSLGLVATAIAESCREGLLQVLQHPSYTVQVHASSCFRAFVVACPQQLLPSITICMNSVNRELGQLSTPRQSPRRCVGYANGLAALLSTSTYQPLYGSVDVYSRVLSQATTLLKSSGSSDLKISSTQIQVAWILLGGLMTLGPNFVKIHLSQLLLLWKNALPKPLNKDHMVQRNVLELSFLAHVRECALGAILAFLEFNSRLLTTDVTKRMAGMLQNTTMFLNTLPIRKTTDEPSQRLSSALQLHDYDMMVRRRVLQCYTKLVIDSPSGSSEMLLQSNLLPLAVSAFADPETYMPNSISSSIASSVGTFETIWDVGDNSGYGVTSMVNGFNVQPLPGENEDSNQKSWITRVGPEASIDQTLLSPVSEASEHDSISLYIGGLDDAQNIPVPPATQVVDEAIKLFAISFPLQAFQVQESILEQMSSFLSSGVLQRDPARKAAMTVNIVAALLGTLKVAVKETSLPAGDVKGSSVEKALQELLHGFLAHPDQYIRNIAAEALGRLCGSSGTTFTTAEVNYLVDQIVANREPNVRSGCALALGCIHSQLGGMAAGFHLKNILGILMSLGNDPHPTVHFWALDSLCRVADSAGLTFSPYVTGTLGMLAQLYVSETHHEEAASVASSNLEVDLPTTAVIARSIDSVINVLGPDLQDLAKARDLIMTMVTEFQMEKDTLVLIETLRCQEHLSLYAPGQVDFSLYVKRLQKALDSDSVQINNMALDGLHNLMRRNTEDVVATAEAGLEERLWLVLNQDPEQDVARNIMRNWLNQTGLSDTSHWVQRCNTVLMKITSKERAPVTAEVKTTGQPDLQDEEVAGFAAASGVNSGAASGATQELLRWQVRTFAMDLLGELLTAVAKDASTKDESAAELALQGKIADVVRIAFSASTAGVVALRIRGLSIIDQVLKLFGKTPDPDFPEASLLEQYQAQIASALTPAFAADSSPELAAQAVNVCATFIATGIVTDVDRMGRILKLLVSALENFSSDTESAVIGDLKGLSSNALVMVKMAVFSAWAELQIASSEQRYLIDVLKPHIARLTPLWLSSLREYARLRFEPDISNTTGPATLSGNLDTIYAALNRETLLQFYQSSWLNLVDAIASLIDEDSAIVFDALDGKTDATPGGTVVNGANSANADINYRDEPVAFFFVLFGLAFEALVGRPGDSQPTRDQTLEILLAMKKILRPAVSGHAIYREVVFSETMDMLDRLVLTESMGVRFVIVEIARNLCLGHPSARKAHDAPVGEETLSEDIDQLFELTRIIVLVLTSLLPTMTESNPRPSTPAVLTDEAVALLTLSLSSLVDSAAVFPSVIRTDLHACLIHIFATILGTPSCQATAIPQALPIFKRFLQTLTAAHAQNPQDETPTQLRGALARFLGILEVAQRREIDAGVACEKNTLLASTILLTTTSTIFDPGDALLKKFTDELLGCLNSRLPTKVAASCCRSLLLMPVRSKADEALKTYIMPSMLSFVAVPSEVEGTAESRALVAHALTSFVPMLSPQKSQSAVRLIIPTLLARAKHEGDATVKETATRLLELAAADQTAFRGVVAGMDAEMRSYMEETLRQGGVGRKQESVKEETEEPTIALKMDFGA